VASPSPSGIQPTTPTYPTSSRSRFFGSLKGILCFPASLIGAYLYESFGFSGIFTASLVISLLTLVFALRIKESKKD
jgi:hypothetical protein